MYRIPAKNVHCVDCSKVSITNCKRCRKPACSDHSARELCMGCVTVSRKSGWKWLAGAGSMFALLGASFGGLLWVAAIIGVGGAALATSTVIERRRLSKRPMTPPQLEAGDMQSPKSNKKRRRVRPVFARRTARKLGAWYGSGGVA